jgi:2-methylisocitrate lyase-like PEP mutase family enzyme
MTTSSGSPGTDERRAAWADRRRVFGELHAAGCFVIPNPWDVGSARLLAGLGLRALATTSSGFAWSLGRPDSHVSREEALAHMGAVVRAVDVPVSADSPGIRTRDEISAVVGAVAPKPVNVLVGGDFTTVAELAELGVRRVSVGGALARAAWARFLEAAREVADRGTFAGLGRAVAFSEINGLFGSG